MVLLISCPTIFPLQDDSSRHSPANSSRSNNRGVPASIGARFLHKIQNLIGYVFGNVLSVFDSMINVKFGNMLPDTLFA